MTKYLSNLMEEIYLVGSCVGFSQLLYSGFIVLIWKSFLPEFSRSKFVNLKPGSHPSRQSNIVVRPTSNTF